MKTTTMLLIMSLFLAACEHQPDRSQETQPEATPWPIQLQRAAKLDKPAATPEQMLPPLPAGVFMVTRDTSIVTDTGITGIPRGSYVRLESPGKYFYHGGGVSIPDDSVTNDPAMAKAISQSIAMAVAASTSSMPASTPSLPPEFRVSPSTQAQEPAAAIKKKWQPAATDMQHSSKVKFRER